MKWDRAVAVGVAWCRSPWPWNSRHAVREMAFLCDSPTESRRSANETEGRKCRLYRQPACRPLSPGCAVDCCVCLLLLGKGRKIKALDGQREPNRQRNMDHSRKTEQCYFLCYWEFIRPPLWCASDLYICFPHLIYICKLCVVLWMAVHKPDSLLCVWCLSTPCGWEGLMRSAHSFTGRASLRSRSLSQSVFLSVLWSLTGLTLCYYQG